MRRLFGLKVQPYQYFLCWLRLFVLLSTHIHHILLLATSLQRFDTFKIIECAMVSKSTSSSTRPTANTAGSHVRRNLFHHHLSRRPTSASTSTSATTMQEVLPDNSSEIVIRDQNGDPSVQIPLLPPLEDDQIQDEETTEKESMTD